MNKFFESKIKSNLIGISKIKFENNEKFLLNFYLEFCAEMKKTAAEAKMITEACILLETPFFTFSMIYKGKKYDLYFLNDF